MTENLLLRSARDLAQDIFEPEFSETFIPTRFPHTYAYDFMRQHTSKIMPPEVFDRAVELFGNQLWSRGEMGQLSREWAEMAGVPRGELVNTMAEAYLLSVGIPLPDAPSSEEEFVRAITVGRADVRALPQVKIELTVDTSAGSQTESMHLTWKEASILNKALTSYLTKHAIRD